MRRALILLPLALLLMAADEGGCSTADTVSAPDCDADDPECLGEGLIGDGDAPDPDNEQPPDDSPESLASDSFDACYALVNKACGASTASSCGQLPGCTAAQLVAQYEPDRCEGALANEQSFPPCQAGACELLVEKVCGDDQRCLNEPTCEPAQALHARSINSEKAADRQEAEGACQAALADETVFAPCP